jgi:hypothetical protein
MAGIQSSFAQWFNRRHGRVVHFFQGRYKAFLVQEHGGRGRRERPRRDRFLER